MPRKTRKQKIRAATHITANHQNLSLNSIDVSPKYSFVHSQHTTNTNSQLEIQVKTLSYIKADLIKTLVLTAIALSTIVYLYFRLNPK